MWQDLYPGVDYALSRQGDQLRIEGSLSFSAHPKMNQAWADDVTLSLYLLDDQGVVQSYFELAHASAPGSMTAFRSVRICLSAKR